VIRAKTGAAAIGRFAMPSDLTVNAVGPVLGASDNSTGSKSGTFSPQAQAPPTPTVIVANPSFRFDPLSGLVVIEFHDNAGDVTTSIPTMQQLEAYRIWGQPTQAGANATPRVHTPATKQA
jgi:hypothetical protein